MNLQNYPKILFLTKDSRYFVSHRLNLAEKLIVNGFNVRVFCSKSDQESWDKIIGIGADPIHIPFETFGRSFLVSIQIFLSVFSKTKAYKPDLIFSITMPSTLIGGLIARILNLNHVALVAGLGTLFRSDLVKFKIFLPLVVTVFHFALFKKKTTVVFQNGDDKNRFIGLGICQRESAIIIPGSGIPIEEYNFREYNISNPVARRVAIVARILRDKGISEFIQSAKIIAEHRKDIDFWIIGGIDPTNPTSYSEMELSAEICNSNIRWLGHRNDIPQLLTQVDIFCLPSYHEGLSKAMLEAAAAGCSLVVSDIPGCRALVEDGVTGLLVPKKDIKALAQAINKLIDDPLLAHRLVNNARSRVEREFSNSIILTLYMNLVSEMVLGHVKKKTADAIVAQ